ncbi:tetratricopeptide repeat protein [Rubrivirga sp. S365]|uniref:histidine kinase n=1 Tax=Rubrivirga litoralis TaxID=3075598 RepID=A0ABU3BV51_9BACT|nr:MULTISPECIES: tetratricopeptide repeat protein [unclassified Rubrivirga]MDT0633157.1 tetratricopeptide repeat protein [Rubrivirga sp. F394]MDT7857764.1 tetratricopeptide repeat protein [Rubrivirga sp. S365]
MSAAPDPAPPADAAPSGRGETLLEAAAAHVPDRPDLLIRLAREARAAAEAEGDERTAAQAEGYEGFGLYLTSDHEAALDHLTRALAALEPLGDLAGRSLVLGALASVHVSLGHYDEAAAIALENLRTARALGDREREAWVLTIMGNTYVELGQPAEATERGEAALRLFADLGNAGGQARAHTVLGGALRDLGRYDEAKAHLEAALRLATEEGATLTEARALDDLGWLAQSRGDPAGSLDFHRRALALREAIGNRQAQATSLIHLGRAYTALGQADEAVGVLEQALAIAAETGAEPRAAQAHEALADAYERSGRPAQALRHLRAYSRLREALLSAQARSRIQTLEVRAEAERAHQDAEIARLRTEELGAANAELERTLVDLRAAQRGLVQAEKLASLGRLSAGLAHEIQNPLNFVANFAELNAELASELRARVDAGDLDGLGDDLDTVADNAARVRDHARRADGIVRSLMGHVRDVGGKRRPADLHELLEQAVSSVFRDAEAAPSGGAVRVERHYADGLGPVEVAPGSLQRVFVNLLDNARYALAHRPAPPDGEAEPPTVTISTERYPGGVEIRVADNGVGIPLAHCARVFEPFFTTKPTGQGTGLGLSLAYDIVTGGHGGTLGVVSREGEGATFTVTLPTGEGEGCRE